MSFFDWRMFSNMIILQYLYFFKWAHGLWEFLWDLVKWESVLWVDYFTILKELLDLLLNNTLICILPRATVDEIIKTKGLKVRKKKRRKEIRSLVACFIHTKPQIKMSSCRQYPLKFSFWLWKQIKVVMFWACELISTVCKCVKKNKKKNKQKNISAMCARDTHRSPIRRIREPFLHISEDLNCSLKCVLFILWWHFFIRSHTTWINWVEVRFFTHIPLTSH